MLQAFKLIRPCSIARIGSQLRNEHVLKSTFKSYNLDRLFSSRGNLKINFDKQTNISRNVLIFSYENDNLYRMISVFGMVQFIFWGNLALFVATSKRVEIPNKGNQSRWLSLVSELQSNYSSSLAFGSVVIGGLVLFFTFVYPQRSIKSLTLLKRGEKVKVGTYSYFGLTKEITVPIDNISLMRARSTGSSHLSMKVKDKWFYYLLDNRDGKFHNPELFDYVIGLQRNLKS